MKTRFSISVIVLLVLSLFSGCTNISLDPTEIIKANMQVKAFLDKYPNAEMQVTYFTLNESEVLAEEIKENCNKPSFEPKEIYRFYIKDQDTNLDLVGYLDINSQNIECIKKYSKEIVKEVEPSQEEPHPVKDESYEEKLVPIKLEGDVKNNNVKLEWKLSNPENVKYFKVMRSEDNADVKYPNQDAFKVIEVDENKESFEISFDEKEGKFWYRISAVLNDEKVIHSNVIQIKTSWEEQPQNEFEFKDFDVDYNEDEMQVKLKWKVSNNDNLKYFKVVRSITNDNPKYPEDGYVKVVNPHSSNEYFVEIPENEDGYVYYRITAVFKDDSKIHSAVKKIEIESKENEPFEVELEGEYDEDNNKVKLEWEVSSNSNIKYFKVVRSTTNDNPKYPEDGYVKVVNPHEDDKYEIELSEDDYETIYYRITTVFNDDSKIHSEVLKFEKEKKEENNPETLEINLDGEYDVENNKIILEWNVNSNENVKYYKIVRSYEHNNPQYPTDGYVDYIEPTDSLEYRFETEEDHTGTEFWYRITTVFKDESRHNSAVLAFIKEEETSEEINQTQTNSTQ